MQVALEREDRAMLRRAIGSTPDVRVVGRGFTVGRKPPLAAEKEVSVVGANGVLGRVVGEVRLDGSLAALLRKRSGLAEVDRLVVVDPSGRIVGRPGEMIGSRLQPERTAPSGSESTGTGRSRPPRCRPRGRDPGRPRPQVGDRRRRAPPPSAG